MADDLDALLAEIPDGDDPAPAADPQAQPDEQAAPPAPKFAALDEVVPEADDIDEDFRGKPISEVIRIATQHKHEIGVSRKKSQEYNQIESRLRMNEAALEFIKQQQAQASRAPEPTAEQFIERFAANPSPVLRDEINQYIAPLQQQLEATKGELFQMATERARERARQASGLDEETWEAITPGISAFMWAANADPRDPRAWMEAAERQKQVAQRVSRPAAEVARPASPPGGNARSQVRPQSPAPRLKSRDRENAADLLSGFGITPDDPAFADFEAFAATYKGAE